MQIAVIILNYKTPDMTIACLESIECEIDNDICVIIVDNNSGDGSCEKIENSIIQNNWWWCHLISSELNGGFAAGNNIGIGAVDAESYILLNSDTIVRPGAFYALRKALKHNPDFGLIAPRTEKVNGILDQNTFRFVTPISELMHSASTGPISFLLRRFDVVLRSNKEKIEPQWVGFACVAIRKEVISQVGLLDERFFMYFEDIDYCRRARAQGWRILYWPEARIIHFLGSSSGVTKKSNLRRRRPKYYYEARAYYFKKYYGISGFIAANILWIVGRCISLFREKIGCKRPFLSEYESKDIWTGLASRFSRNKKH